MTILALTHAHIINYAGAEGSDMRKHRSVHYACDIPDDAESSISISPCIPDEQNAPARDELVYFYEDPSTHTINVRTGLTPSVLTTVRVCTTQKGVVEVTLLKNAHTHNGEQGAELRVSTLFKIAELVGGHSEHFVPEVTSDGPPIPSYARGDIHTLPPVEVIACAARLAYNTIMRMIDDFNDRCDVSIHDTFKEVCMEADAHACVNDASLYALILYGIQNTTVHHDVRVRTYKTSRTN